MAAWFNIETVGGCAFLFLHQPLYFQIFLQPSITFIPAANSFKRLESANWRMPARRERERERVRENERERERARESEKERGRLRRDVKKDASYERKNVSDEHSNF